MLTPITRAVAQLQDPVFQGVIWRSLAVTVLAFAAMAYGCVWVVGLAVTDPGWLGWLARLAGGVAAAVLAVWLFVPVALLIATLYIERVAAAVDRRFYPLLPVPQGAPLAVQAWDGMALGAQVLALQLATLVLAVLLPGPGVLIGWLVAGWAIGRGLFVAVAMRRMDRPAARALYEANRLPVLVQGVALAFASSVPGLNLLVPVVGTAAMVHVLNRSMAAPGTRLRAGL